MRSNSFIKTWMNIIKQKLTKFESLKLQKNSILHFEEHYTKTHDTSLIFISFFFSETNIFSASKVSAFWVIFVCIFPHLNCISPYSGRIRENTDQNNSEYGHFSRSVFNLGLIGILASFRHHLFSFLPFDYHLLFYGSSSSSSTFLYKNQ